ncbi:MAG: hypothetical protein ACR2I2_18190 [Bryobacteraceae bacterium]
MGSDARNWRTWALDPDADGPAISVHDVRRHEPARTGRRRAGGNRGSDLFDEPTKSLDDERRREVALLLRLLVACGKTVVTVSHDIDLARCMGGAIVLMREGEIVEMGR